MALLLGYCENANYVDYQTSIPDIRNLNNTNSDLFPLSCA
jgi:hypothetical protein